MENLTHFTATLDCQELSGWQQAGAGPLWPERRGLHFTPVPARSENCPATSPLSDTGCLSKHPVNHLRMNTKSVINVCSTISLILTTVHHRKFTPSPLFLLFFVSTRSRKLVRRVRRGCWRWTENKARLINRIHMRKEGNRKMDKGRKLEKRERRGEIQQEF